MAALHLKNKQRKSHWKQKKEKHRKKNSERLVTMQYDDGFFTLPAVILCRLGRLGYCRKCHILEPQSKQLPILHCSATPMGNPKMPQKSERV